MYGVVVRHSYINNYKMTVVVIHNNILFVSLLHVSSFFFMKDVRIYTYSLVPTGLVLSIGFIIWSCTFPCTTLSHALCNVRTCSVVLGLYACIVALHHLIVVGMVADGCCVDVHSSIWGVCMYTAFLLWGHVWFMINGSDSTCMHCTYVDKLWQNYGTIHDCLESRHTLHTAYICGVC